MRRRVLFVGSAVIFLALLAGVFLVVAPAGSGSAQGAALHHVRDRADRGTATVLASRAWGDGRLVLVGYQMRGVRRLGLAFAAKQIRGWRVSSYTEKAVEPDDVVVGSLLVAMSGGGKGQPPWSAAVGELIDSRIARVQIHWASGATSTAPRTDDAYIVVERDITEALEARYLSRSGSEIARVPVAGKR
jgi:hypothetical protein